MRNPWAWLVDRLWPKASKACDAAAHRIVCGTPYVWAEEQQHAAEWALADQDPSYGLSDGCVFFGKDQARGLIAEWRKGKDHVLNVALDSELSAGETV